MNRTKLMIAAATLLLAGAALGYWITRQVADHAAPVPATAAGRRVLYWHDPMVPGTRFDKPGKSPFMDMQLVPVYADEEGGANVRISPQVTQNLGMRLATAELRALRPRLAAVGNVAFDERLLTLVQARVAGYVTRMHVKTPLERVRRGQPLADVVAPEWLAAQEEYLALLDAQTDRIRAIRDAARQRLRVLDVPEAAIRAIESERRTAPVTTIVAPAGGVVADLGIREGASFVPGAALFRINGLDTVWVNAAIPEAQVSLVFPGSSVEARATAWPGDSFRGRVAALLPDVDPQTRTLTVRLEVDNPEGRLAPGMFVALEFAGEVQAPQIVVPSEAIIVTGERKVVIVARPDGGFDLAEVTTGIESESRTAVLAGLTEGQSVVVSGQFLIDSEASLKSALTRLDAGEDAATPETAP